MIAAQDDTLEGRIDQALWHARLVQKDVTTALGVSKTWLTGVKKGRFSGGEKLKKLAEMAKVDASWLETGKGNSPDWARKQVVVAAPHDASPAIPGVGSARAGLAEVISQVPQKAVRLPKGCQYLHIEGRSAEPVLFDGQLAILAPEGHQVSSGDIVAVTITTGKRAGQSAVKWLRDPKADIVELYSKNSDEPPLLLSQPEWQSAYKRWVIGAFYIPHLLKTDDATPDE